jgi:hypothetical protein
MPELALDMQHGSKIRFSTHADISLARPLKEQFCQFLSDARISAA